MLRWYLLDTRTWSIALWLWSPWHRLSVAHSHCGKDQKDHFLTTQETHSGKVCKCLYTSMIWQLQLCCHYVYHLGIFKLCIWHDTMDNGSRWSQMMSSLFSSSTLNDICVFNGSKPTQTIYQQLTVRISLCVGRCRLWFACCGLQSRECHPLWTSSPSLLAEVCHSATWTTQTHMNT